MAIEFSEFNTLPSTILLKPFRFQQNHLGYLTAIAMSLHTSPLIPFCATKPSSFLVFNGFVWL